MDRHEEGLMQDCKRSQAVAQNNQGDDNECFNSNMCNGNPCCKKLKSRIGELELEINNLKKCISSLSSQLHEAHEKAEDTSFIKNESVITLADKLDAVTSMLEEKKTQNVDIMDSKDHLINYDLVPGEMPEEVCVKVKNKLMVAEHKMTEISDCIEVIKLSHSLRECKVNNIFKGRECID